jgi:hypothetical protein
MASVDVVLSRLEGVRKVGRDYVAKCPAHDDRSPSLTVSEGENGRILLHCFAGCEALAVLEACGLRWEDVMPDEVRDFERPIRRPFDPAAILHAVAREALVAQIAAAWLADGKPLPAGDRERLVVASERLHEALDMVRGYA